MHIGVENVMTTNPNGPTFLSLVVNYDQVLPPFHWFTTSYNQTTLRVHIPHEFS